MHLQTSLQRLNCRIRSYWLLYH